MAKRRANGEGNIRKRKDGRWEGRYTAGRDPDTGKVIYKNVLAKTQKDCKEKLKRAVEANAKVDAVRAEQYTVGQWMDVWFENCAKIKVRPSSHKTYRGYIDNHIKPSIGKIPLSKLSSLDLQKLYKKLLSGGRVERIESKSQPKGLSAKTVRNINQVISSAMDFAVDQKLISTNPTNGCALPKLEHREMKTLPAEQLASFLHEAKESGVFELYYIELATGLRRGELLGLKWEDIDLERGTIQVRRQIARIDGKVVEAPLKTKNSYRSVSIGQDAVEILKEQVFFIRDGKLIGREHFYMTHVSGTDRSQILLDFVKQFYAGTPFIPRELMLQEQIEDGEVIEQWLSKRKGARVRIKVPKIGSKEKLVELAARNASLVLSQDKERIRREEGRTIGAVKEIALLLGLENVNRMEAFDISNISGFANVGSMVVYEKGKPKRSDYRKFRIKTVSGPDDYACMKEVLTRRFLHGMEEQKELEDKELEKEFGSFTKFPDLLLMDGGKGQVNIALDVLKELDIHIPVCGMVKDDNHRTRGLYFNNVEIPIDRGSEGFKLITRIQDEAHRFAIEYHRSLRSKGQVHSVLDDIPGIRASRRKALMMRYSSLDAIRNAGIEELAATPSMNMQAAEAVYQYFHTVDGE